MDQSQRKLPSRNSYTNFAASSQLMKEKERKQAKKPSISLRSSMNLASSFAKAMSPDLNYVNKQVLETKDMDQNPYSARSVKQINNFSQQRELGGIIQANSVSKSKILLSSRDRGDMVGDDRRLGGLGLLRQQSDLGHILKKSVDDEKKFGGLQKQHTTTKSYQLFNQQSSFSTNSLTAP